MDNKIELKLKKSKSFNDMLDVIKENYILKKDVGFITKSLIITGLNARLENKLNADTVQKLKNCTTVGDMVAIFYTAYNGMDIKSEHQEKVINGLKQIITMTAIKQKK